MFVDTMKKKDSESPGSWTYLLQLLEEEKRQSSKFFLKRHFGGQSKLLNLAGQTVNYGALNGLIIVHVLTERFNKWFHLIIYAFNDLKIHQIHHCTRTNSRLFYGKPFPPTFFASTLAVAKYQLAWETMKRGTTKKINYKIIKNAGAKIRVVGSWANVRNFAVYLHQKSYNTTRKI